MGMVQDRRESSASKAHSLFHFLDLFAYISYIQASSGYTAMGHPGDCNQTLDICC